MGVGFYLFAHAEDLVVELVVYFEVGEDLGGFGRSQDQLLAEQGFELLELPALCLGPLDEGKHPANILLHHAVFLIRLTANFHSILNIFF